MDCLIFVKLIRPSKINSMFLVQTLVWEVIICYYFTQICYSSLCKILLRRLRWQIMKTRRSAKFLVFYSLPLPFMLLAWKSVCNVFINDNQALLKIHFHHNSFRNKVVEQIWKITKIFKNQWGRGWETHFFFIWP